MRLCVLFLAMVTSIPAFATKVGGTFILKRMNTNTWHAEYCFEMPVEAIRFNRPFEDLRRKAWHVADTHFELVQINERFEIRRKDNKPFNCTSFELTLYQKRPQANYYAFSSFSDGGVSVYTGYFFGQVLVDDEWYHTELHAEYSGRNKELVITHESDRFVQQFVYFGPQDIMEDNGIISVIDPAIPTNAKQNMFETVSTVNNLIADDFDFHQKEPYMIFIAADFDAFDGYSIKGGTLKNQILFTFRGREALSMLEDNADFLVKTMIHEMMHLWQMDYWLGELGNDRLWVHEGGAEALTIEIMHRIGIYNDNKYERAWRSTEQKCLDYLKKTSIHLTPENNMFDAVYPCGSLAYRLVGEVLNPRAPGEESSGLYEECQPVAQK